MNLIAKIRSWFKKAEPQDKSDLGDIWTYKESPPINIRSRAPERRANRTADRRQATPQPRQEPEESQDSVGLNLATMAVLASLESTPPDTSPPDTSPPDPGGGDFGGGGASDSW